MFINLVIKLLVLIVRTYDLIFSVLRYVTKPFKLSDTTEMNRLLWFDEISMVACFQAGAAGKDIEAKLQEKGYTLGHEPDSFEFSTLGGW